MVVVDPDDFAVKLVDAPSDLAIHAKDDAWLLVHRLLFHWTVMLFHAPIWETYSTRWCYATREGALAAIEEWRTRDFEGEPTGWHRHPSTGRRRRNGDPATEYVEF